MQSKLRRLRRPLANKFFVFTATLAFWLITVMLAYDLRVETLDAGRLVLLLVVVILVSAAVGQFTSRALARPVRLLRDGLTAVESGELAPIEVQQTKDEVQHLAESFNQMIQKLAQSQQEIRRRVAELEQAIQQAKEGNTSTETREQLHVAEQNAQSLAALLDQLQETPAPTNVVTPL
jgi:methyl-accepting chemotaxis protein